jgi:hypothetical protein
MSIVDKQTESEILEVDGVDLVALLDEESRRFLGISGEEFRRRLHAGEFDGICDDPFGHPDLTRLMILDSFLR